MFVMPAPGQQAVVTVNYTQGAVLGGEFIGRAVGLLERQGVEVFDVSAEAEAAWTQKVIDSFVDPSIIMSACTPSRLNNEGHPEAINPRSGNYGRGFGDWFGYRELLERWLEAGRFEGLDIEVRSTLS
jgi:cyclohexanone monooxygenase/pentalenolactone D synthase